MGWYLDEQSTYMTDLTAWRNALKQHLTEFAPLAKEDPTFNRIFGLTAAVLW
jgi:hypothetical protein